MSDRVAGFQRASFGWRTEQPDINKNAPKPVSTKASYSTEVTFHKLRTSQCCPGLVPLTLFLTATKMAMHTSGMPGGGGGPLGPFII